MKHGEGMLLDETAQTLQGKSPVVVEEMRCAMGVPGAETTADQIPDNGLLSDEHTDRTVGMSRSVNRLSGKLERGEIGVIVEENVGCERGEVFDDEGTRKNGHPRGGTQGAVVAALDAGEIAPMEDEGKMKFAAEAFGVADMIGMSVGVDDGAEFAGFDSLGADEGEQVAPVFGQSAVNQEGVAVMANEVGVRSEKMQTRDRAVHG